MHTTHSMYVYTDTFVERLKVPSQDGGVDVGEGLHGRKRDIIGTEE